MKISVDVKGLEAVAASLRGLKKEKIDVAKVAALNDAAYLAAKESSREMARVFDKPTPWVLGGVRYVKARRDKQEASVDFDKWGNKTNVTVEKVLAANIYAGTRKHKRHEVALNRAGILPAGMGIVPGDAAKLDGYGNMTGGQIVQIIAWFKAFGEQGYRANIDDKGKARIGRDKKSGKRGFAYFALQKRRGNLLPGVYQRFKTGFGSAINPVMIFVRMPAYRKRFDFYGVADRAARKEFDRSFPMYLEKLLSERGL